MYINSSERSRYHKVAKMQEQMGGVNSDEGGRNSDKEISKCSN